MTQKKRVVIGLLVLAIAAIMTTGGLYAYYQDIEQNDDNQIDAGTLDLVVNGENPWASTLISAGADVYPGFTDTKMITVENTGTINGLLSVRFTNIVNSPGETTEPEGALGTPDLGELGANLDIVISDGSTSWSAKLDSWTGLVSLGALNAGQTRSLTLTYSVNSAVGNVIQDDSVTFTIEFVLDQVH